MNPQYIFTAFVHWLLNKKYTQVKCTKKYVLKITFLSSLQTTLLPSAILFLHMLELEESEVLKLSCILILVFILMQLINLTFMSVLFYIYLTFFFHVFLHGVVLFYFCANIFAKIYKNMLICKNILRALYNLIFMFFPLISGVCFLILGCFMTCFNQ